MLMRPAWTRGLARCTTVLLSLLVVGLAGCADGEDPAPVVEEPGPSHDPPSATRYAMVVEEETWVEMSDGVMIHNAVYRPDTTEPVGVFINFSPYWGDTAEERGDAFSRYMIEEYVPRGFAVVLSAIRGTGHSGGCFEIASDREAMDLHEVVDHFADMEWSNGNVAAGGKSYDSTTQNGMIAKFPHPALKGIFHVSGISDMYAYNYKGGVPYVTGPVFNTYYWFQGTDEYGVSLVGAGSHEDEDVASLARLVEDAACTELPETQAHGVGSGATGQKTDYWIERDWTRYIGDSDWNGSIFFVHGLQDWNVKPDHILPWIDNLPEQIRVKGWLHQGGHVYPERTDWNATMLAWLDSELNGKDTGIWETSAWEVRSDDGTWYQHEEWPPEPFFNAQGQGTDQSGTQWAVLEDDPPLHLSGEIALRLRGSFQGDGVVTAVVYDESPSGDRQWVTEAVVRGIYADGLERPGTPGAFDTEIRTYPFDHVFQPGHTVRIVFQDMPRNAIVTQPQLDAVTITSHELGLPHAQAAVMDPQPIDMECFAC